MKIFTISGLAQHGKDTFASYAKKALESKGYKVLIAHYGDLVKYTCKTFFDWDGQKDDFGRSLLQKVGTDNIRAKYPNFWVDYIAKILTAFKNEWDYVLIPDTRFHNEIDVLKNRFEMQNIKTIKIYRPNFDNGLTEEQKNHASETSLNNYKFDYVLENDGTLEDFYEKVCDFFSELSDKCD